METRAKEAAGPGRGAYSIGEKPGTGRNYPAGPIGQGAAGHLRLPSVQDLSNSRWEEISFLKRGSFAGGKGAAGRAGRWQCWHLLPFKGSTVTSTTGNSVLDLRHLGLRSNAGRKNSCWLPGILPRDRGFRQSSKPRILDRLLFLPAFPSRGPWVSVEPVTQQVAYHQ